MKLIHTSAIDTETTETIAGRTFLVEHLDRPVGSGKRFSLLTPGESGAHLLGLVLASAKRGKGTATITEVVS